jgi:hypothetical protein
MSILGRLCGGAIHGNGDLAEEARAGFGKTQDVGGIIGSQKLAIPPVQLRVAGQQAVEPSPRYLLLQLSVERPQALPVQATGATLK